MSRTSDGHMQRSEMLAESGTVKSYIGKDVILATHSSTEEGLLTIIVGNLYDYAFLNDIPFGTAFMIGAAKLVVSIRSDENKTGSGSWSFPTRQLLQKWASGDLPARMDFVESELPVGATAEEIRNVSSVVLLQSGVKEQFYQIANELVDLNRDNG